MEEKVSIIVPVYNAQNYIKETIESVQKQDYTNWELILVENGSTDDSLNCIQTIRDERIRVICAGDNIGAARARNLGMQEATGEYVCYLDADDLWDEDKLSSQIAFMKEKQAAFSFTGYSSRASMAAQMTPRCFKSSTSPPKPANQPAWDNIIINSFK